MSEQLDLIALHQAVVANEQQPTDYTKEHLENETIRCSIEWGKEKTERIIQVAKLYADKHRGR